MYFLVLTSPLGCRFILITCRRVDVCGCLIICTIDVHTYVGAYTGSPKNMYTHFNRWYLCIVFEVELNYHYNM
jgi:hypothetical protein